MGTQTYLTYRYYGSTAFLKKDKMEAHFEIETLSSIWSFNFDAMMCWRRPKAGEGSSANRDHPLLSYKTIGAPKEFTSVAPFYEGSYIITYPNGDVHTTGSLFKTTGDIPEDHLEQPRSSSC